MEKSLEKIRENLEMVRATIAQAASRSRRNPQDVTLIGVTKYVDSSATRLLFEAGCRDLAESRPQQLWQKGADLQDLGIRWHLIGHLQRNKAKRTLSYASMIHSIDSTRILDQLNEDISPTSQPVQVLIEVNATSDQSKTGLRSDEARMVLAHYVEKMDGASKIRLVGIMGMSSMEASPDQIRREFAALREYRDDWSREYGVDLPHLSMGMSDDYSIAIEEGATMVRIGSKLFA